MNKFTIAIMTAVASLAGCATITQGTQQAISFKLEPKEAICDIMRVGDGKLGRVSGTSNTIFVGKDKDDIVVTCNADGYEQSTTKVVSGATGAGVTGVLIDFGITDMITGAMYRYPEEVTIVMQKVKAEPVAAVTP
ncbi:hypothetical protein [Methylovorus mays]|uniref:hypothetical protein n=1 Tax=Methylovorus mays TaxID=184077 RepID=UPI001E605523|nr:hypothetical protein [Methylovorus mays]MCB5205611.1 hypothetical protein [Methylovorus mays]